MYRYLLAMSTQKNRARAQAPGGAVRYRPFGAFRLLLAGMVLAQHGALLLRAGPQDVFYSLELGTVAVTVFFAVSGFVVAEALSRFYNDRPGAFLANRMLRLLPPYLLALVLAIGVQSALFSAGRLVALGKPLLGAPWQPAVILAGLFEIVPGMPPWRLSGQDFSFIPYAWTLRVEFAFYVAAFATCVMLKRAEPANTVLRAWVIGLALAFGYAAFTMFLLRHGGGARQFQCVPFFAFGVAIYVVQLRPGIGGWMHVLAVATCVPLAFACWIQHGHPVLTLQLGCVGALLAGFYLLSRVGRVPVGIRRIDSRLGDLSYPLYIGHGVVLVLLASLAGRAGWWLYALGLGLSLLLAALLHQAAERPLRSLRESLRGARV